ncbi:MAG: aspartyl protease family protein [Saprospiraceae bacterium]|nr:aspartyl protease family protein [Saprospiraceae bacterium]
MRKKAFNLLSWLLLGLLFSNPVFSKNEGDLPAVTQFELVRGMVIVQAELNGQSANFILDTGSPMMILNEKMGETASIQASSLQGGMAGEWKTIGMFSWAGVRKFDMPALTTDVGALEYVTDRPIAGLIGYKFLEDFDLLIDFENLLITLVPQGKTAKLEGWNLKSQVPFTMAGHLPVIEVQIGDKKLRLGLDTGANTNMLDLQKAMELEQELVTPVSNAGVMGMTGGSQGTYAGDVVETTIGGLNFWNMRFVFSDISHLQNLVNNGVDGLLGYPFFKAGKFSINYSTKMISIWE